MAAKEIVPKESAPKKGRAFIKIRYANDEMCLKPDHWLLLTVCYCHNTYKTRRKRKTVNPPL